MLFRNWLKTLTVDFSLRSSRRDRRKTRSASGQISLMRGDSASAPIVETLEMRTLLSVDPVLVKDVNVGEQGSDPSNLVDVNGTLFFMATDGVNGYELWQSDGTSAGTTLVKDIRSGTDWSEPSSLTNLNGMLFFTANDGSNGVELWKSDGTSAGTTLVKDIVSGISGSYPGSLTNVNGTLFFNANDGVNGVELWKSDGTSAGTTLVKDINGSFSSSPGSLTNVNGTLFFSADNGVNGYELWQSDGTSAGTTLVNDIISGSSSSVPDSLVNVNGTLFFTADNGVNGYELWQSDGTSAGTTLVKDIKGGVQNSFPDDLTNVNGTLFFSANDGTNGYELWQSDGTAAGTTLVKDINSGSGDYGAYDSDPSDLQNVNGTLFFSTDDGTNGRELWKSDGTAAGTTLVKDINSGSGYYGPNSSNPRDLTYVNGTLFFSADDGTNGRELWSMAGNNAPKWPLGDPRPAMVVQTEDDRLAMGTTVASLTTTASDVDVAAKKGIAIFEAASDKGVWQFTINGGTTWTNIPATSRTNARLLPANGTLSRVRFVPNQDFNGTVQLGFFAWDQTQGTAGGTFDISTANKLGGITAFSTGLHRPILTVSPVPG